MEDVRPGSDGAVKHGCVCPRMDNGYGEGYMGRKGVYVYSSDCPIHKPIDVTKPVRGGEISVKLLKTILPK